MSDIDKDKIDLLGMVNMFGLQEDFSQGVKDMVAENVKLKSELETYKKIAEKLAEILSDFDFDKMCESCNSCIGNGCTAYEDIDEYKECIIDWARKEVEKDV